MALRSNNADDMPGIDNNRTDNSVAAAWCTLNIFPTMATIKSTAPARVVINNVLSTFRSLFITFAFPFSRTKILCQLFLWKWLSAKVSIQPVNAAY